ncbi:hypothetical protein S40288_03102 [Stachybotrys chartarum IBT 40288]|nr:hypothetical protein S40288_03102 [Stachybotrys chartarum IBT 40288]
MASLPHRTYKIQADKNQHLSIKITEAPCQAEGLHLATWSSAFVLSNLLHEIKINTSQLNTDEYSIVELGAGTGLTGLSAAAIWKAKSLLTDLPTIVPGLQANADLNSDLLKESGGIISCGTLDWNDPENIHIQDSEGESKSFSVDAINGFPVVLAADTMYTEDHPRLLSQATARCLRRSPDARAIICYNMRVAYLDYMREFWELMEGHGLVAEQEGRKEIDSKDFDDEKLHEWSVWKWKDL